MLNIENCCNCTACYHSCPRDAISLEVNSDGFPVPIIDLIRCIQCNICEKVCPMLHPNIDKYCEYESPNVYGAIHKSAETRRDSQSGGAFTAISDVILDDGGIVYGCRLNEKFEAIHDRAATKAERDLFRGSKYVQSNMGDVYPRVKADLLAGHKVLFSGTPCQISGLKNYLRQVNTDKLVCVDLICHGVPSPKTWSDYLSFMLEKHHGSQIQMVNFRNKNKFGWHSHVETVTIDGKEYDSKVYTDLFYAHTFFAPSCFTCPFRSTRRVGDITIADYWGIKDAFPEMDDNKGVSEILVSSDKGKEVFNEARHHLTYNETTISKGMNGGMLATCVQKTQLQEIQRKVYAEKGMKGLHASYYSRRIKQLPKTALAIPYRYLRKVFPVTKK